MALYILKDKTYDIPMPEDQEPQLISEEQLKNIANSLSEHFGCFMIFGMSLRGEPQFLMSSTSGMEYLALQKFAEDTLINSDPGELELLDDEEEQF